MPPTNPPPASDATPTPGEKRPICSYCGYRVGEAYSFSLGIPGVPQAIWCGWCEKKESTPGAGGAGDVGELVSEISREMESRMADMKNDLRDLIAERDQLRRERDAMFEKAMRYDHEVGQLKHERDALRAMLEKLPHHDTCKWWRTSNPGLNDCTCGKYAALARSPAAGEKAG